MFHVSSFMFHDACFMSGAVLCWAVAWDVVGLSILGVDQRMVQGFEASVHVVVCCAEFDMLQELLERNTRSTR